MMSSSAGSILLLAGPGHIVNKWFDHRPRQEGFLGKHASRKSIAAAPIIAGLLAFPSVALAQRVEGAAVEPTDSAARLATVTVEAKPIVNTSGPNSRKYDLFLRRRNHGMGTFLTREQIESRPVTQTWQLFQNIPGLKISHHGTQWFIRSQRCPAKLTTRGPPPDMDRDIPGLPILFIDGLRVRGLGTMSTVNPSEIEAIEVYQGAAQMPGEVKGNTCAAIFLWLKQSR